MKRILFVCMGNICRSPIAEGVLRTLSERAGLKGRVEFDSAGTAGAHAGEAPDERARKVAASRGYDLSKRRARRVGERDFARFDLILAMDSENLAALQRLCPDEHKPKLALFLEHCGVTGTIDVPDPYYGNIAGFERVLDLCEAAGQRLVDELRRP